MYTIKVAKRTKIQNNVHFVEQHILVAEAIGKKCVVVNNSDRKQGKKKKPQ